MSFQEKYQEYKQRKEAKAFFNQNNAEKVLGKDYLIAFLVGTGVSIVLGFIMETIIYKTGINFSYIAFLVGVLEAMAIKKVLKDFRTYLEDNGYSEDEVDDDLINEYCTDLFYDLEDEEDLDNLNETEEIIRDHYGY